ncbi:hypothetical protein KUCAC02_000747, partial [Chaenocephalus aceratus]
TWLWGSIPDVALQLGGFQLFRADHDKSKGGGICFYTNSGWCNDVTVILQHSSPTLETFNINCKPFYSPREEGNILDHCYTTIKGAYHAVPRAALGHSDHTMAHRIPAYRKKLKLCKPVVRTFRQWSSK